MSRRIHGVVVVLAALSILLALVAGGTLVNQWLRWRSYTAQREEMYRIIAAWERRPPPGVDGHVWQEACKLTGIAVGNVCFSPSHVSLEELADLRAELAAKEAGRVDIDTLQWVWDRLATTGPHGRRYIQQMRPLWDEARDALQAE